MADGAVRWDVFLSHSQATGGDQCKQICTELQQRSLRVWYDQRATDEVEVTAQGMREGVRGSAVFLVFLSHGYFSRPFCRMELDEALAAGKKILLVHETDGRHGAFQFLPAELEGVPAEWHARAEELLQGHNSQAYFRQFDHAKVLFDKLERWIRGETEARDALGLASDVSEVCLDTARQKASEFAAGTRQWMFDKVEAWGRERKTRAFVVTGVAGVGKSVFAGELCRRGGLLDGGGGGGAKSSKGKAKSVLRRLSQWRLSRRADGLRVGACHFFRHDDQERTSNLVNALRSIAGQLAARVPGLAEKMREVDARAFDKPGAVLRMLIGRPCEQLDKPENRYLVVLDALDECAAGPREQLLALLQTTWTKATPAWLCLVITTRPESYIPYKLRGFQPTELQTEDESNKADLLAYLKQRLKPVVAAADVSAAAALLAERSGGLFLYARFLDEQLRERRGLTLRDVREDLEAFPAGLEGYYETYFERLRNDALGGDDATYRLLLSAMCAVRAPLPEAVVKALFGLSTKKTRALVDKARNLLYAANGALRFVHKTMADWLLSEDNLSELALDPEDDLPSAHERLAEWCVANKGDAFALRHAAFHLGQAGMTDALRDLLLDFDWLLQLARAGAAPQLVLDVDGLSGSAGAELRGEPGGVPSDAALGVRALEKSLHAISRDPNELPSQLVGRLPAAHPLASQAMAASMGLSWLCPVQPSLTAAGDPLRKVLEGHEGPVKAVALQSDIGVSGGDDRLVRIWDRVSGQQVRQLEGHTLFVESVAVDADVIVSAGVDGTVRVWDRATGQELATLEGHSGTINSVALGKGVIVSGGSDATVRIWDRDSGRELRRLTHSEGGVSTVAVSDALVVAGGWDQRVRIWDRGTGEQLHVLASHGATVVSVALAGDLVASGDAQGDIYVWDCRTGAQLASAPGHADSVESLAFAGGEGVDLLVSGSADLTVRVWDARTGGQLACLEGSSGLVASVAVEGNTIMSGSRDGTVRMWDLQVRQQELQEQHPREHHDDYVSAVAAHGDLVVSGGKDGTVRAWSFSSGRQHMQLATGDPERTGAGPEVSSVAIGPTAILAGSTRGVVRVWDRYSGALLHTIAGDFTWVTAVALHGDLLVFGTGDRALRVWSLDAGAELRVLRASDAAPSAGSMPMMMPGHPDWIQELSITEDGFAVVRTRDEEIMAWSLESGERVESLDERLAAAVAAEVTLASTLRAVATGVGAGFTCDRAIMAHCVATDPTRVVLGDAGGQLHFLKVLP